MYIKLINRPDRMGANLTWYIMQIIYAHYNKYLIKYEILNYSNSIFMKTIMKYINEYNEKLLFEKIEFDKEITFIEESQQDWTGNNMIVCSLIKTDLFTYFNDNIKKEMTIILENIINEEDESLKNILNNKGKNKKIGVHLRIDDVCNRTDYNGIYSTEYYANKLNNNNLTINLEEEHQYGNSKNIFIPGWNRCYNPYDCQAPLDNDKIQKVIEFVKLKYPEHEVILIASKLGDISLPYKTYRSGNIDEDLLLLSICDVLICSRSLYCLASVYFGNYREVFLPMWGHFSSTGLTSKYDNSKFNYFY